MKMKNFEQNFDISIAIYCSWGEEVNEKEWIKYAQ